MDMKRPAFVKRKIREVGCGIMQQRTACLKLRTPKGAWRVKMFKLYGANPTPMAFSEVFTALQTGVIDGQAAYDAVIWAVPYAVEASGTPQ